jgi:putative MFS transporter
MLRRGFMAEYTQYWKRIYAVNWIAGVTDYFTVNIWPMIMAYLIAQTTFLGSDPKTATVVGGILATLFMIGNTLGALIMADPADRWGRKKTLQGTIGLYALGCLLTGLSPTWMIMAAARFIEGLGNGGEDCGRVPYIMETVHAKYRATLMGLMQASQSLGSVLANLSVPLILAIWIDWRYVWFLGAILALIPIILLFFVPESRRWMETRQAIKEGKLKVSKTSYGELFKPEIRRATLLAVLLQLVLNTASWGYSFWLPTLLFVQRQLPYGLVGLFTALNSVMMIVGLLFWGRLSDAIGRRKTLAFAAPLGTIMVILVATVTDPMALLATVLIAGFLMAGAGNVVYTLASEWFPTKVRATGWGFALSVGRIASTVCSGLLPGLIAGLGVSISWIIIIFGIFVLALAPIGYAGVETAKKELEEI